jgi:hypothetical protein
MLNTRSNYCIPIHFLHIVVSILRANAMVLKYFMQDKLTSSDPATVVVIIAHSYD